MNIRSACSFIALTSLAISATIFSPVFEAAAQTASPTPTPVAATGWNGVGYLSTVSILKLKPVACEFRLVADLSANYVGTQERSFSFAPLTNYSWRTNAATGTTYTMTFDLPRHQISGFLYKAGVGTINQLGEFAEDIREMGAQYPNTSCEISFTYNSKSRQHAASLQCGTNSPGNQGALAQLAQLDKTKLALQKLYPCNH